MKRKEVVRFGWWFPISGCTECVRSATRAVTTIEGALDYLLKMRFHGNVWISVNGVKIDLGPGR